MIPRSYPPLGSRPIAETVSGRNLTTSSAQPAVSLLTEKNTPQAAPPHPSGPSRCRYRKKRAWPSSREYAHVVVAFRRGLSETGYVEERNVLVDYRGAEGHNDRLPIMAADLVRREVAVITATGGVAAPLWCQLRVQRGSRP